MIKTSDLKTLIKQAYELFSSYTLGDTFQVCYGNCCLQMSDGELIKTLAVDQLELRLIYEYLAAAQSNDIYALAQQMKYFVPRILDLLVDGEQVTHSIEISLNKCHMDYDGAWEKEELKFMQKFALDFFEYQALQCDPINLLDEYVIMFHLTGMNIQFLLDKWLELLKHHSALISLARMLSYHFSEGFYTESFAEQDLKYQMSLWIKEPLIQNKILDHFLNALDDDQISSDHKQIIDLAAYQIY